MAAGNAKKAVCGRMSRTVQTMALSLLLLPAVPSSLATSDRPDVSNEVKAALFTQALDFEVSRYQLDTPISRLADRGGRVRKSDRVLAFRAGSLVSAGAFLDAGLADGDAYMRTALAASAFGGDRMTIASAFQNRSISVTPDLMMTASLRPAALTPGATASDLPSELAYAPSDGPSISSRFDDLLKDRPKGFVPPLGEKDHAWAATPLDSSVFSKKEQTCLATGIYFEARGETEQGQAAVAQVILNRVRAPSYPDTICGVVYQNQSWKNRCQFSFACDGIKDRITNKRAYSLAEKIALDVTQGARWLAEVGSSTHYHATYVKPRWARAMERMDKIGLHVFYRTLNGGWN